MRLALAFLIIASSLAAEGATRSWSFRVSLDGREIGRHTFTRAEGADGARVVSEARFDVRFLFVSAYRYEHRAEERWRDGCLVSLEARTDDNGARKDVRVQPEGCTWSFAYWDPGILRAPRLLNAQTGEVVPVRWAALGTESLAVRGNPTETSRHRLTAPGLRIDLWYAGSDWVALESIVEGGRRLRYELS
jgi:hypothetical protein